MSVTTIEGKEGSIDAYGQIKHYNVWKRHVNVYIKDPFIFNHFDQIPLTRYLLNIIYYIYKFYIYHTNK